MHFASAYQMEQSNCSRRDDLISLCYILIFLINGEIFSPPIKFKKVEDEFKFLLESKKMTTAKTLCGYRAKCLRPFAETIFDLSYKDRPDYKVLK